MVDKESKREMNSHHPVTKNNFRGDRLRLEKLIQYSSRLLIYGFSVPFTFVPEGRVKHMARLLVMRLQNSVTTRLFVNRGDTVLQIGTPWPQTMHRYRKAVGENGRLVIFEAMEDNFRMLQQAVTEAGYKNVTIFQGAAWNERSRGKFMVSQHPGDHKIQQDDVVMDNDLRASNVSMNEVEVEFYTVDDVLKSLGIETLDHLSVTVNGAEFEVLQGAKQILQNSKQLRVYTKAHARSLEGEPLSKKIIPFLNELGYEAIVTRGEVSSTIDKSWLRRDGDVYGWKSI